MNKPSVIVLLLAALFANVYSHGRLVEPAGRATLWRYPKFSQFNPVPNYNDNECFCGGFHVQYDLNFGRCGVCGDPYHEPQPRAHEGGGIYGRGIITQNYTVGQVINVTVELTAAHLGYFEFRLCPHDNPLVPVSQECLDQYLLELADGSGTKYPIPTIDPGWHNYQLQLPERVTCRQCVLQWHYRVGNSHGYCEDGSYQLGCGNQETFRGCADVAIN